MANDLSELIERVRVATKADREIDNALFLLSGQLPPPRYGDPMWEYCEDGRYKCSLRDKHGEYTSTDVWEIPAPTSSIDAAIALAERVLPGWDWIIFKVNGGLTISCKLGPDTEEFGETPALALCLAILTALKAQEDGREG